jgi:hypothetical protein
MTSRALRTLLVSSLALSGIGYTVEADDVAGLAAVVGQAARDDFHWEGALRADQELEVFGINGSIHALPAAGGRLEIVAAKSSRRSDPATVTIEVVPHGRGVTVCAIYPARGGDSRNRCLPGGPSGQRTRDNDVVVDFTVRIPPGSSFLGRTVNGSVTADGLQGRVDVRTVNGRVDFSTTDYGSAETVNGSITAVMGRTDWSSALEFKTVNGSIELDLGGPLDADIDAETLNGSISTDFAVTMTGSMSRRRLRGTIGNGGRALRLETVNGSIVLRRRS